MHPSGGDADRGDSRLCVAQARGGSSLDLTLNFASDLKLLKKTLKFYFKKNQLIIFVSVHFQVSVTSDVLSALPLANTAPS